MSTHAFVPALDTAAEAEAKWLIEVLLGLPDCDNFRKLEEIRRGIRAVGITPRFRSPILDLTTHWANIMYEVLKEIDQDPGNPYGFTRYTARFLEVGSNPGGFTRYILEKTHARGVGITLPTISGGVGRATLPSDRFELHELDLLDLVSRYRLSDPNPPPLPFSRTEFDSIILDIDSSSPRVLVGQLLLALATICNGGQILFTLTSIERPLTARILIAVRKIADHISVFKPLQDRMGLLTGKLYLHAEVVRNDTPAYRKLKDNLRRLWSRIQSTDTCTTMRDPSWNELDLITPWEEVMKPSNVDAIVKLGNPLWKAQLTALSKAVRQID
ncbi:hypothetical protein RSOLAG22IIIB_04039 [Rhizoctonia solani]|uniref:Ribosomal RNA methyltransferase FtsJ domain-containing protein n=1 Tax=Rhizoctonia solani TaxID=456999 RepID=A0A0K6FTT4_9AGAM|nr:hypothetical protein RSOLAG22IIIB_04039 [Rhizoctonia solani]